MSTPQNAEQWQEFWQDCYARAAEEPRLMFLSFARSFPTWKGHQTIRLINYCTEGIMARGKKDAPANRSNSTFQQTQFVDIPVVEQDWADVQKIYGSSDALVDTITDLLDQGYRVGLSFNSNNDAFICSVTCRNPDSPNNGYTFNAFAETWFEAMQLAAYKHFVKSGGNWLSQGGKASRPKFG